MLARLVSTADRRWNRDEPLKLAGCLMAGDAVDNTDLDRRPRQPIAAQRGHQRRPQGIHIGTADGEDIGAGDGLRDLVLGDARIGAQNMTKSTRGHRGWAITEIVVASPADVGHSRERAAAPTRSG